MDILHIILEEKVDLMKSLQTKMLIVFSLIFVLSSIFLSYSIYQSSSSLVVNSVSTQAKLIGEKVVSTINVDQYEQITLESGETDYYFELREGLTELKEMNGLKYLYTMARSSTNNGGYEYYYVVDGSPLNSEDASALGDVEENQYDELIQTFETGKTQIGEFTYDEEYGATVTAYVPITNNKGETIGVVGADFDAENIYQLMNDKKKYMILMTVAVLAVMILVIFIITRMLIKPLKELSLQMKKVRTGDFNVQLQTKRKDEIGELTHSFNEMVEDVKGMIHTVNLSSKKLTVSSEELAGTADQNSSTSELLSEAVQDITQGANRQVAIISNAVEMIQEMTTSLGTISNNLLEVSASSQTANTISINGKNQVEKAIEQIEHIKNAQFHSSQVMKELGEKSKEIDEIVVVITDIASQTNLLALNASIEAARAGEHGRGFAVVSEEVGKLAEQSAGAAKGISHLIKEIQLKTQDAVETMENGNREVERGTIEFVNVSHAFNQINEAIQSVAGQIKLVSESILLLSSGSAQIVQVIGEVHDIADHFSHATGDFAELTDSQLAMIQEVNASIEQLNEMSGQLENLVHQFKI